MGADIVADSFCIPKASCAAETVVWRAFDGEDHGTTSVLDGLPHDCVVFIVGPVRAGRTAVVLDVVNPPCRPLLGVNGFMIARSGFLLASMGPFCRIESAFETQGMDRLSDGLEPFWEFGRISYLSSI